MKIIQLSIAILLVLLISGCYTKNDLIQRQIDRDKFKVTTIITKQGNKYNFIYQERLLRVEGDFLDGTLVDGSYQKIPVSEITSVNKILFESNSPVYLYAIFGFGFLAAIWYAATKR